MRADRLLNLLMMLQVRDSTSAVTFAAELGTSVRTVYRDIAALERTGVPIVVDRGRDGGFRLAKGYQARVIHMSSKEAEALPFTHLLAAASDLGLRTTAQVARAKMIAALPNTVRKQAVLASARFYLDPVDWYARSFAPLFLKDIATATFEGQTVVIDYESWTQRRMRMVEPLGIVCKAAKWYLVARHRKRVGIYRIDSVRSLRVLPNRVVEQGNFNLQRAWQQQVTRFEADLLKQVIRLRVSETAMSRLSLLGGHAEETIRAVTPDETGWRTADIWTESIANVAGQLLAFADQVVVLLPAELRLELARRGALVAALYT